MEVSNQFAFALGILCLFLPGWVSTSRVTTCNTTHGKVTQVEVCSDLCRGLYPETDPRRLGGCCVPSVSACPPHNGHNGYCTCCDFIQKIEGVTGASSCDDGTINGDQLPCNCFRPPEDLAHRRDSWTTVTFYERCTSDPTYLSYFNITLPLGPDCEDIPCDLIPGLEGPTWRQVISGLELANETSCIILYTQVGCTGNSKRVVGKLINLCADFGDITQSYRQC